MTYTKIVFRKLSVNRFWLRKTFRVDLYFVLSEEDIGTSEDPVMLKTMKFPIGKGRKDTSHMVFFFFFNEKKYWILGTSTLFK